MEDKTTAKSEAHWYDAYPAVKSHDVPSISRSELLGMIQSRASPGQDFILVDLRRTDHEGGSISGSINLPAQSLYSSLPTIYTLVKSAKIPKVIWYCGSSRGRGTRAAGWFQDLLVEKGDQEVVSLILAEGVAGWAKSGEEYTELMDEYDPKFWHEK